MWTEERAKLENTYLSPCATMTKVAAEFNTTVPTVRKVLIDAGLYQPRKND